MTSSLRKKRRTTRRVGSTLVRTAANLVGLGLFLAGTSAFAQDAPAAPGGLFSTFKRGLNSISHPHPSSSAKPPKTLYFFKDAAPPLDSATPVSEAAPNPVAVPPPAASIQPPTVPAHGLQQTAMQQPPGFGGPGRNPAASTETEYTIQLQPPGPQRLFRLDSERALQERMRQEALQRPQPERVEFPPEPSVSNGQIWKPRQFPPAPQPMEPAYVCYGRLYFEDLNSERYGWDLGFVQPFVSALNFYKDLALLPYHWASDPCRSYECSAGYCLPGDPVPYALYPPGLSVKGLVAEGAAWVAFAAMFP